MKCKKADNQYGERWLPKILASAPPIFLHIHTYNVLPESHLRVFESLNSSIKMSQTIEKVERPRIDAFELWCWRRLTLESPLDCKIQPDHPKGDQSWILTGRTDIEAETPILRPPDTLEKTLMLGKIEGRRRGWQRMRWLDGINVIIILQDTETHRGSIVYLMSECDRTVQQQEFKLWQSYSKPLELHTPSCTCTEHTYRAHVQRQSAFELKQNCSK